MKEERIVKKGNRRTETVKLILESLVNQNSIQEIINCIFSFNYKNIEIKKIVDFLIQEEGQLKIIELLLNLDNIKNQNFQKNF